MSSKAILRKPTGTILAYGSTQKGEHQSNPTTIEEKRTIEISRIQHSAHTNLPPRLPKYRDLGHATLVNCIKISFVDNHQQRHTDQINTNIQSVHAVKICPVL